MAQNDLEFTSEITLDTTKAKKSLQDLSAEVSKVFQQTSAMASASLLSSNFGFSSLTTPYAKNIQELKKILATHSKNIAPLLPDATEAEKKAQKSALKDLAKAQHKIGDLAALASFMAHVSKYDTLYSDIKRLQELTASNAIAPDVGLGRYGVFQRYANRFQGLLYKGNLAFPGIVGQAQLELGEYHRDINRKSGSQNRSALRYIRDKQYRESALSQARDYLMLTGDTDILRQLSAAYGFDFKASTDKIPEKVNAQALSDLITWSQYGLSAQAHKQALLAGGLSKEDRAYHTSGYREDMRQFIRLQQKLFPQEKEIATNLKKLNQADIIRFGGKGGDGWLKTVIGSGVGLAGMNRLASAASSMLESYWGESIQRNVYASQQAYYKRWEIGGKVAGSVAGGVIGAIIGGAIGSVFPGVGTAAGSMVGAGIGGGAGSAAGLYGTYMGTKYQGDIKSSNDIMARIRAKTLYGRGYNPYFAQQITDFGIANGEAALQQMSHNAQTFRARVMLGQVGEQEWLYLSMMPNYFNALMSGVSGQALSRIYANDLKAIGDPSMRYVVGEALGGTEALAMATNPYFDKTYGKMASMASLYDARVQPLETGYVSTRAWAANENVRKNFEEIVNTAYRADPTIFNKQHLNALRQMGIEPDNWWLRTKEWVKEKSGISDWSKPVIVKEITNVINLNGEEIGRQTKTADQMYEENLQSFYIGGN